MSEREEDGWERVAAADELADEEIIAVELAGEEIALCRVEGELWAFDVWCTHAAARLCDGWLEGHEIECPLHGGKFDVRTGKALCEPVDEDVTTYPVRVEGNDVYARVPK